MMIYPATLPLVMSSGAIPNRFMKLLGMINPAHTWWCNRSPLFFVRFLWDTNFFENNNKQQYLRLVWPY